MTRTRALQDEWMDGRKTGYLCFLISFCALRRYERDGANPPTVMHIKVLERDYNHQGLLVAWYARLRRTGRWIFFLEVLNVI
jgi:hypothetical protein